jgi:hypothetical protein
MVQIIALAIIGIAFILWGIILGFLWSNAQRARRREEILWEQLQLAYKELIEPRRNQ